MFQKLEEALSPLHLAAPKRSLGVCQFRSYWKEEAFGMGPLVANGDYISAAQHTLITHSLNQPVLVGPSQPDQSLSGQATPYK